MASSDEWCTTRVCIRTVLVSNIYINDIDLNISGDILKFADDTKVICPIENEEYGETLQAVLDRLMDWSIKWQMLFNIEK